MCILNTSTSVLTVLYAVTVEVFLKYFTESISLRKQRKSSSCLKKVSPNSSYLKAVKGALISSALPGVTSELTNSNRKKNSQ